MNATATAERGADTREAILQAALHSFSQHGFDGTSVRDIVTMASDGLTIWEDCGGPGWDPAAGPAGFYSAGVLDDPDEDGLGTSYELFILAFLAGRTALVAERTVAWLGARVS